MKIGIYTDQAQMQFPERFQYVIDQINNHPLLPDNFFFYPTNDINHAHIIYGQKTPRDTLTITQSGYLFNQKFPRTFVCGKHLLEEKVYYSIGMEKNNLPIEKSNIPFDLFETIFFHLSRVEEIQFPYEHFIGRKEAYEKNFLVIKNKIQQTPIVDHLIALLIQLIIGQIPKITTRFTISHDIDEIRKFKSKLNIFKKIGGQILHRKNLSRIPLLWNQMVNTPKSDPFDTSTWMIIPDKYLRKEIYFLSGGRHKFDNPYPLTDPIFSKYLEAARKTGYKIGIHPSYLSWNNLGLIKDQKQILEERINEKIEISRQHFLNFDIQKTPALLKQAGIKKDSSIGFSRHIGFRCGTGFDYFLYDFETEQPSIKESPMVFMDVAALYETEWNMEAYLTLKNSFLEQNRIGTHVNFLYHNTIFDELEMGGHSLRPHYLKLFNNEK
jgi:hypothetical protein